MNREGFSSISVSGTYCGTVMARDDDSVENEETHLVTLNLDGDFILPDLMVIIIDNDGRWLHL